MIIKCHRHHNSLSYLRHILHDFIYTSIIKNY